MTIGDNDAGALLDDYFPARLAVLLYGSDHTSMAKPYLSLAPSEQAVTQAAAQIYAAHIVAGRVTAGEEAKWREQAIHEAIEIAKAVDAAVHADGEMT